jgi:hypothetical protein
MPLKELFDPATMPKRRRVQANFRSLLSRASQPWYAAMQQVCQS